MASNFSSTSLPETFSNAGSGLVSVKKESLNSNEILGLFKVKSEPISNIKSKDDDVTMPGLSTSDSVNRLHGIRATSNSPDSLNLPQPASGSNIEDDDFMGPPPADNFGDDELDEYSRGYDFDDIIKPDAKKKKAYSGIYGVNDNFVLEGHKTKAEKLKSKLSDPQLHTESDNDSDSVKDYDMFKGKASLGKPVEDSQSIASLEFVTNKNLNVTKDDADTQSQSSAEFVNFELGQQKETLPESKSVDSLDLHQDVIGESLDNRGSVQEKSSIEPAGNGTNVTQGPVPILGDRYSAIMSSGPSVST